MYNPLSNIYIWTELALPNNLTMVCWHKHPWQLAQWLCPIVIYNEQKYFRWSEDAYVYAEIYIYIHIYTCIYILTEYRDYIEVWILARKMTKNEYIRFAFPIMFCFSDLKSRWYISQRLMLCSHVMDILPFSLSRYSTNVMSYNYHGPRCSQKQHATNIESVAIITNVSYVHKTLLYICVTYNWGLVNIKMPP